ncbi:MAG: phosphatidylcholine/phosphatidylserine synthase [Alphaproteobacteria bacterium]
MTEGKPRLIVFPYHRDRNNQGRLRPPRLRGLAFHRLIPNILTVLALCCGVTAIRFSAQGRVEIAVLFVVLAGIFDGLDGRMARLLKSTSAIGAELDSLSDFVSFGIAPAMALYYWSLHSLGGTGWGIALIYIICCGYRLARFNTKLGIATNVPTYTNNYFTGVPAPGGAGLAMMPMMLSFGSGSDLSPYALLTGIWALAVGFLMASTIPTFSIKRFKIPQRYVLPTLLVVGLTMASMISDPWLTLATIGAIYLASICFSVWSYHRLQQTETHYKSSKVTEKPQDHPDQGTSA